MRTRRFPVRTVFVYAVDATLFTFEIFRIVGCPSFREVELAKQIRGRPNDRHESKLRQQRMALLQILSKSAVDVRSRPNLFSWLNRDIKTLRTSSIYKYFGD